MADHTKKDEPELLPPIKQEYKNKTIQEVQSFPPSVVPFSTPSKIPFVNKLREKAVKTYTDVIRAETDLLGALASHSLTKGRLRDIDVEIETDHLDRENKLREAQRTAQQADQQDKLADLDIKTQIAEKEKRLKELTQEAPPPKSQAEKWAEELKEEEAKHEHNLNRDMLMQKSKINRLLRIDKEKKKQIEEIENEYLQEYNVRRVTQLPPEAIQELEEKIQDIEDLFNQSKAES